MTATIRTSLLSNPVCWLIIAAATTMAGVTVEELDLRLLNALHPLSHLHAQVVQVPGDFKMAINCGLNRVRFSSPILARSRIRAHVTLQFVQDAHGGIKVLWLATVEIEGNPKPALVAEWLVRFYYG